MGAERVYAKARRREPVKTRVRDYANLLPLSDPFDALELLYTKYLDRNPPEKRLMPYSVLGPAPRGVDTRARRYLPFIEHAYYGGWCDLDFHGAKDWLLLPDVAHKLVMDGWVEETSVPYVYAISLLGIALYAARRKKYLESLIGNGKPFD